MGRVGAAVSDLLLQPFGLGALLAPVFLLVLAWKWVRSKAHPGTRWRDWWAAWCCWYACCTAVSLAPRLPFPDRALLPGGLTGLLFKDWLISWFNLWGTVLVTGTLVVLGLYLTTSFSLAGFAASLESRAAKMPALNWRRLFRSRKSGEAEKQETAG